MIDPAWDVIHTARTWGRWPNTRFVEWAMHTYGEVDDRRAVRFLDLGCGAGAQLRFLEAEGFSYVGVDGSEAALFRARMAGLWPVWHADLTDFEIEEDWGKFDCVMDICTLQHLSVAAECGIVQRARYWLKPGGCFFMIHAADNEGPYGDVPPPRVMSSKGMANLFAGYKLIRTAIEEVVDIDIPKNRADSIRRHWIIEARSF